MSEFMLHGLAAMFLAAVSILSKRTYKSQMHEIDLIEIAYLKKYGLKWQLILSDINKDVWKSLSYIFTFSHRNSWNSTFVDSWACCL